MTSRTFALFRSEESLKLRIGRSDMPEPCGSPLATITIEAQHSPIEIDVADDDSSVFITITDRSAKESAP